ncbi:MAG: ImmA/IrrE family metallo-endopeptidase [Saprospiraceae bacterium]|nr:ImmA/IrrE family metallo-endopeptidase [Saprospiraceae bacterium]
MKDFGTQKSVIDLRKRFGLRMDEPIPFKSLLLKNNIITIFMKLDDDFSGMAVKANNNKFILINSNHSIGRQHFSICHELYHLFIDENFTPHRCLTGTFNKEQKNEFNADVFAANFLIPETGLFDLIPDKEEKRDKISLGTIIKIEQYFACSRRALLSRLKFLRLISNDYKQELSINIKMNASLNGYSLDLYEPGNDGQIWGDYGSMAQTLFKEEKISEGHFASLMADIGVDIFNINYNDEN